MPPIPTRGSVVRFNISENDSRKSRHYAGLWVRADGRPMTGLEIYNNTVMVGPWTDQAALINARGVQARLRNNIFIASSPALPLRVEQPGDGVRFENNLYWRQGGPTEISWGAQIYSSLQQWRDRTGQELSNVQPTGLFADPLLSPRTARRHPRPPLWTPRLALLSSSARLTRAGGRIGLAPKVRIGRRRPGFSWTVAPAGPVPLGGHRRTGSGVRNESTSISQDSKP